MVLISSINLASGNLSLADFLASDWMALLLEAMGLSALRAGIKTNQDEVIHEVVKKINFPHAG